MDQRLPREMRQQSCLDSTSFYAESGGQTGDHGCLRADSSEFKVKDCQKKDCIFCILVSVVSGSIDVGQKLYSLVDASDRLATGLNHSATHLLHAALRQILGEHVSAKRIAS